MIFPSAPGAGDPFTDLISRSSGTAPVPSSPVARRVPTGRLCSGSARSLLEASARRAAPGGSNDPDTGHPLRAATRVGPERLGGTLPEQQPGRPPARRAAEPTGVARGDA
ncbi:hypothetical protein LN042_26730 [Kitasatospora sp. RB6PN24]|uniref:hypothetical protein n=1 Tax=Kitasatospora humi TaxID=2893891 RepID=UPI001E62263B|nr:hypothetical protein [Kitasatospora humi]MCC9310623.1 hypothetical protein [Kitasatospora humi]